MTGSRLMHWILCCLVAAAGVAGCSSDTTSSENTGSLGLSLELADGITINEVEWTLTGNGMPEMSGTIDTSAPGATASVEVFGLPPGEDYLVELEATSEDEEITCRGAAEFDVEIGVSTDVMVMLNCKRPARLGGVRVNGKFNICAELAKAVVSPLQTSVGNDIDLAAAGVDVEGDDITYVWSNGDGTIADPNAQETTYTCAEVGDHEITITISDDDFEYCMDDWTVLVTCVAGEGDLCDDVDCDDDNECTDDLCDPATGECSNPPVDDGADCGDGGMCVEGECVNVDLCEGVECPDTGNDCTVSACNMEDGQCDEMNAPDGIECNDGSGLCSQGECLAGNLCEGVDCSSSNACIQDGACDPASGECIPGDAEPADTPCEGGGVCDGSGSCGECNNADQCGDTGNECTTATCTAQACGTENVMDGAVCDLQGGDGICESGACVEAPDCNSPGDCDDGNVCTAGDCVDGMCSFSPADGGACEVSPGVPGTCGGGSCVGLCDGVDCSSSNECVQDGACDDQTGQCVPGNNEPAGTTCADGVCNGNGACVECILDNQCPSGEVCVDLTCVPSAIDPDPQSAILGMGCTNNVTADVSILPFTLEVDPSAIIGDAIIPVDLGGEAEFAEFFLDAAQGAVPGGVTSADLINLAATVLIRTGGTLPDNTTLTNAPIPATCLIILGAEPSACNPANDLPSVPGSRGNSDCIPTGNFNPCQQLVTLPTSDDCAVGGECDMIGKGPGTSQCDTNGFCVTGGLPLPLVSQSVNFQAAGSGDVLFGYDDQNTGALPLNGDGTYNLPGAVFTAAPTPNEIKVNASGLSVALACTMAVDSGGPDGVGVPDQASPTPDADLPTFPIQ